MSAQALFPRGDPEAEKSAAKKVADMLSMPENLAKVGNYRMSILQKRSALEAQLKTAVQANLEEARTGLELLDHSYQLITSVRNNFNMIDELCKGCQDLIGDYPLIRMVNTVRSNLYNTLREVDKMLAIPEKAAQIEKLLENDINILTCHTKIRELESMNMRALVQSKKDEEAAVKNMFKPVVEVSALFEQKLWDIVANCIEYGQNRPAVLVKAMQIVEREEKLDEKHKAQLESSDDSKPKLHYPVRGYRAKTIETLHQSISGKFDKIFADAHKGHIEATLEEVNKILDELYVVTDDVAPCFPPSYDIFDLFVQEYHKKFYTLFFGFSDMLGKQVAPSDILLLVQWVVADYGVLLARLGIAETNLNPPLLEALEPLFDIYTTHVRGLMDEWAMRIIETDRDNEPEIVEGQRQTMAPVHLFESVNTQIDIVKDTKSPRLIVGVLKQIAGALEGYQDSLSELCATYWKDLEFLYLIAVVNNSSRCYDLTQETIDKFSKLLPEQYLTDLDFDPVLDGFQRVCKDAIVALANVVFNDLEEVFGKFFNKEWYEGDLIGMVIGTLEDYFENDLHDAMLDSYTRRFAQSCLDKLIFRYAQEMLTKKHAFNQATVEKMTDDLSSIREFFVKHVKPAYFDAQIKALEDLKELLDSEADMICLYFDSLLRNHAGVSLRIVEILLSQREDLSKSEQKEAILGCKDILDKYSPDPNNPPKEGLFSHLKLPVK
eukprot:Phypoly_transcript_02452.p1 GENE.Phypoly_transcript_02452~~Phypoly_transcript_02452.p1  ORF type:complete len:720 (+),score=153.74 Phypoly_transcript_02452:634-2793(+)